MKSIWSDGIDSNFKTPDSPMKTEVLIIGGGLCGVLCAYFLDQKGVDYILVESGSIGGGITINTTAKITAQHGLIYDDLLRRLGHERAGQYLNANLWAVEKYSELSENIPCDFERKPAYVYSIENGDIIEKELDAVTKLGFGAEFSRELCLPFHTEGAIKFPNQAQFDPIKFINGIARGLHIFENTFVEKLSRNTAKTKYGTITADKIIVATHYPMINLAGLYSAKMYQERSYVIALKDAGYVDGMYLDAAKNGMSFRNYKEFLLVGGGGHRTGRDGGGWQVLRDFSEKKISRSPGSIFLGCAGLHKS